MHMTALRQPSGFTDADLAALARTGDPAAIDLLFARHATSVLRIAYRLLNSLEDAEDVTQEVFVGLPRALRHYSERGRFDPWLRRLAARAALARLRQMKRRRESQLEGDFAGGTTTSSVVERLTLEQAISSLPVDLRTVLVLRKVVGYTHAEIASLLGIRRGTSEVRLHRAIRALRAVLGEDG